MLSQIERDEIKPTLQVACQIAEALNVSLSSLLGEHPEQEAIVIRKQQRLIYKDQQANFERHLLSPSFPSKGIEFILNMIPAGKQSGVFPPHQPGVKEYIAVSKGKLRIVLGMDNTVYDLDEGDSFYFEADVEHQFINLAGEDCQYYLVIDSHEA